MKYMTISEVSKKFSVSARMLRYYEKLGMLESTHQEGYAYRMYDDHARRRLLQIIILRKLQLPLKQIRIILDGDAEQAAAILDKHILELDGNLAAMQRMKAILQSLAEQLRRDPAQTVYTQLANDRELLELANALPLT